MIEDMSCKNCSGMREAIETIEEVIEKKQIELKNVKDVLNKHMTKHK